ncbi:MAG: aminotransferase class V-fold PLP-dependent enzyme [Oscillospiraceae bacterium]|jgi:cysteine desulfurase|nr:aminotransferase class V-fold PLP-dependent enzyme [Oscillospiraceae bacterium]
MVYLDNSATAPPLPAVIDEVARVMRESDWNPSALYRPAIDAERIVRECREDLKRRLGAERVVFTSGGTESDNLAVLGASGRLRGPGAFLFSAAEHAAVLEQRAALESRGHTVRIIPLTREGLIDTAALEYMAGADTALIAVTEAASETGAIQPLWDVIAIRNRKCPAALVFADAAQGFMRTGATQSLLSRGVDMVGISAHKIHGPKGVGALAMSGRVKLRPLAFGGGQEDGMRPGTENVAGIAGLRAALAAFDSCGFDARQRLFAHKLQLLNSLRNAVPDIQINGPDPSSDKAAPHIVSISMPGIGGEPLVHALEREGVYVGTGSACSSRKKRRGEGFISMGVEQERADRAIRVSLSPWNTMGDMAAAAEAIAKAHESIYQYRKR